VGCGIAQDKASKDARRTGEFEGVIGPINQYDRGLDDYRGHRYPVFSGEPDWACDFGEVAQALGLRQSLVVAAAACPHTVGAAILC
jgi:hypothetical protein